MIVSLDEVKEWLRIDEGETTTLVVLIQSAENYLKYATGKTFDNTNDLAKLFCLVHIADWYENRLSVGKTTDKIRFTIDSILLQLQYGGDEV